MLLQRKLLLNTKRNYIFNIIATFNVSDTAGHCPRINSWTLNPARTTRTLGNYIESNGIYVNEYSHIYSEAGVDVFYWNVLSEDYTAQDVTVTSTGAYEVIIVPSTIESPDQSKYQLVYNRPGRYDINISIFDKV